MDEYRKVVEIPGTDNYIENAINSLENFDSLIYGFVREGYDWVSSFDTVEEAYNAFIDSPEQFIQDVGLDKYELTDAGNCLHIKIAIAAYPNKREVAVEILKQIITQ